MNRREILIYWFFAVSAGSFITLLGATTSGPLFPFGLAVNMIASITCLSLMRPFKTRFTVESTLLCLASLMAFAFTLNGSYIVVLVLFSLAILPPAVVLGTAVAEYLGASWIVRIPIHAAVLFSALFAMMCLGVRIETPEPPQIEVASDALADKNPAFLDAPEFWNAVPYGGESAVPGGTNSLEINKSAAVIALDVAAVEKSEASIQEARFAAYRDATAYLDERELPWVPSVQMVDHKVKHFSDAAYAAIDRFTQREAEALGGGRQVFLEGLLEALLANKATEAAAFVATAVTLSGKEPALPPQVAEITAGMLERFRADQYASKPVGYYAENEELGRVFQQNRFCQYSLAREFEPAMADRIASDIARVLKANIALAAAYDAILALQSRTTNPPDAGFAGLKGFTPGTLDQQFHLALFPPSGSVENALYLSIYDFTELPDENIMNRLIRAIRDGEVELTPDEHSGWYDYQVHALETLLVPERGQEGEKLLLSKAYKERLIEAFRSILTKQRELHIGHLYTADRGAVEQEVEIVPEISVEPTATHYLRSARALRFLETAVSAILGEPGYASITLESGEGLAEALPPVAQLLYGLYIQVCEDIGMTPEFMAEELTAEQVREAHAQASTWLEARGRDEVFASDVRYIVPALTDARHTEVRYWMTTGIRLLKVKAEYARAPRLRLDGELLPEETYPGSHGITFVPNEFYIPVEEFAEATGPNVPYTREEFRALCDAAGSREGIIRAVENGRFSIRGFNRLTWIFAAGLTAVLFAAIWRLVRRSRRTE